MDFSPRQPIFVLLQNTVFVDIDQYTKTTGENEVLFNIGSVFKIEEVNHYVNRAAWIIKMSATDEDTYKIKEKIDAKKREFHQENINLMFGRLLLDMNEYTKDESYFQMMLQVLPTFHEDLAFVYDDIGDLNMRTTNWQEAFTNFDLAYEINE
jgi:tetratricopeptide (TPR) repeat protein